MPYASNNETYIHYHIEGQGQPIVMLHGWSDSLVDWYTNGYVDSLKAHFQLILIDTRGHGYSDKPQVCQSYVMDNLVADVIAVLDHAGLDKAICWGYSMGGRVGFALAAKVAKRFIAFIVGGINPNNDYPKRFFTRSKAVSGGMTPYLAAVESKWGRMRDEARRDRFLANDAVALSALTEALGYSAGMGQHLSGLKKPVLMYVGQEDPIHGRAQQFADASPRISFVSLSGLNHASSFERRDLVIPRVLAFLSNRTDTPNR